MRDLGGYPAGDGGYTAYGRLLRSDAPIRLPEEEERALRGMGVGTVIDLRMDDECARNPCALLGADGFTYHRCAMNSYAVRLVNEDDIPRLYMAMVTDKATIFRVMDIIAGAADGVLFHCTAGKDRTGVIAALLLSLAGVSKNDILADYQVSYTYLRPIMERWNREYPDWPAFIGQSNIEYMESFLEMFQEKYGDVERYLSEAGLSGERISSIKKKLGTVKK